MLRPVAGSFRDPSGRVYEEDGRIVRTVTDFYAADYDYVRKSGLFESLQAEGLLVSFRERDRPRTDGAWKELEVERIPFVSYPYEWSFSQLRDAALLTLRLQKTALERDAVLKDASAFNVQFLKGRPVFIDLLSFRRREEGRPWEAYGQFCRHFLAPLLLMATRDLRLNLMLRDFLDGIPLDLASGLLPPSTWFSLSKVLHIHAHAKMQARYRDSRKAVREVRISRQSLTAICDSLEKTISRLRPPAVKTEWGDYYSDTNYTEQAFRAKEKVVEDTIREHSPSVVLDMGANNGHFSRLAAKHAARVVSPDVDPLAVDLHYRDVRKSGADVLPLVLDLTNPTPALGWNNGERDSFFSRVDADMVLALALVHHMAISGNVPFSMIAEMFAEKGKILVIEFVPKEDSQVRRLLRSREDIFAEYDEEHFRTAFDRYFSLLACHSIPDSLRKIFVFEKRPGA